MKNTIPFLFAIVLGTSCQEQKLVVPAAQCVTTSTLARVSLDDEGTFGISANDVVALLAVDGTVLLDNSSPIDSREVTAFIDMTAGMPAEEIEQALDSSGEVLEGQICHDQLLRVPITVSASIETVGDVSGAAIMLTLPDGTPYRLENDLTLTGTGPLAAELAYDLGTTCQSVSFQLGMSESGWQVYYAADCDDASSGGRLMTLSPID